MLTLSPPAVQIVQTPSKGVGAVKVISNGPDQLALRLDGKIYPIQGHSPTPDGFVYRVELNEYTSIQQVYFWGVTEWHDLEDENGQYFELAEYHIELDPKHPQTSVEKPNYLTFWGRRIQRGNMVEFRIVKLSGMSRFKQPQTVRFQIVH